MSWMSLVMKEGDKETSQLVVTMINTPCDPSLFPEWDGIIDNSLEDKMCRCKL